MTVNQKEELVNQLKEYVPCHRDCGVGSAWCDCGMEFKRERIAIFILEDRKRIVAPLADKAKELNTKNVYEFFNAMDQTLTNAGIERN